MTFYNKYLHLNRFEVFCYGQIEKNIMKTKLVALLIILFAGFYQLQSTNTDPYTVTILDNPSPGYIFLDPLSNSSLVNCLDNSGGNAYSRLLPQEKSELINLQVLPNGLVAGLSINSAQWILMDKNFNIVDSLMVPGSLATDFHELVLLSNGNYLVIGGDEIAVDMSLKIPNGDRQALVKDFVLYELNSSRQIIFQWRVSEHYNITDATVDVNLTDARINPFHLNSVKEDNDGNLIISCRHLDEVSKVNRQTGEFIWRLGGSRCRNNQFTFISDTYQNFSGFSHQHNAQVLPNGHVLLFDNGNLRPTPFSRAVEYEINTTDMTATKVWEYRHTPDLYTYAMGDVQRLENGNTLIGWGTASVNDSKVLGTEVTSDGTIVFEITHPSQISYRIYKFVYNMDAVIHTINSTGNYNFDDSKNTTGVKLNITNLTGNAKLSVEKHGYLPYNRSFTVDTPCITLPYRWVINQRGITSFTGKISISTNVLGDIIQPNLLQIYRRSTENKGRFAPLATYYNPNTKVLEANISGFGEFMIGYKEYYSPQLELPVNNSYGHAISGVLEWKRISTEEKYDVQLSVSSKFDTLIVDTTNVETTQIVINNLTHYTDYYWRVKARTPFASSSWSDPFTFQTLVDRPVLVTPNNYLKEIPVSGKINWAGVAGANMYRLQISDNIDFINPIIDRTISNAVSYDYKNLDNFTNYYWRVSASNRNVFGEWSDAWHFQTIMSIPKLTSPSDNQTSVSLNGTMKWNIVKGALFYNLQAATDSAYQNLIVNETGITKNQFDYKNFKAITGYYWRVKALNNESKSDWSDNSYFFTTLPATNLIIPKNNAGNITTKTVFSWELISGVTDYLVEVSEDITFKTTILSKKINSSTLTVSDLNYNTKYYWRVKVFKQAIEGEWSETRNFTTLDQNAVGWPDLTSPANQSNYNSLNPLVTWESVPNAEFYEIEIASDAQYKNIVFNQNLISNTSTTPSGLNYNTKYYWHVRSSKSTYTSDWSDTWSFTTKLRTANLLAPSDKQTEVKLNDPLQWESVEGGIFYWVQIATDPELTNILEERENLTDQTYIPQNLNSYTNYYWRIKVRNAVNKSDWSEARSFTTGKISTVIEILSEDELIYPNPASEYINLEKISYDAIDIYNSLGNLILHSDQQSKALNLKNVPSGVYTIRILYHEKIRTLKLIVSK